MRNKLFPPFLLAALMAASCSPPTSAVSVSASPAPPAASSPCAAPFHGTGRGASEGEAKDNANAELAKSISSSLKVIIRDELSSKETEDSIEEYASYLREIKIETELQNAGDARDAELYQENGQHVAKRYMCKSDAAKPYLEQQRLMADSLEQISFKALDKESWSKAQELWNRTMGIQTLIKGWGVASEHFDLASRTYSKMREDRKDRCAAKLHWNPEHGSPYSEIAFHKLSGSVKMEKSPCMGKGISLVYKGQGAKCEHAGIYGCQYQPSLLIADCKGAERQLLKSPDIIKSFNPKEEVAAEKLQEKLKAETFWEEWENKIKQWSPKCEQ